MMVIMEPLTPPDMAEVLHITPSSVLTRLKSANREPFRVVGMTALFTYEDFEAIRDWPSAGKYVRKTRIGKNPLLAN